MHHHQAEHEMEAFDDISSALWQHRFNAPAQATPAPHLPHHGDAEAATTVTFETGLHDLHAIRDITPETARRWEELISFARGGKSPTVHQRLPSPVDVLGPRLVDMGWRHHAPTNDAAIAEAFPFATRGPWEPLPPATGEEVPLYRIGSPELWPAMEWEPAEAFPAELAREAEGLGQELWQGTPAYAGESGDEWPADDGQRDEAFPAGLTMEEIWQQLEAEVLAREQRQAMEWESETVSRATPASEEDNIEQEDWECESGFVADSDGGDSEDDEDVAPAPDAQVLQMDLQARRLVRLVGTVESDEEGSGDESSSVTFGSSPEAGRRATSLKR